MNPKLVEEFNDVLETIYNISVSTKYEEYYVFPKIYAQIAQENQDDWIKMDLTESTCAHLCIKVKDIENLFNDCGFDQVDNTYGDKIMKQVQYTFSFLN